MSTTSVQDDRWSDHNPDFTLEGGDLLNDCCLSSLVGQPAP